MPVLLVLCEATRELESARRLSEAIDTYENVLPLSRSSYLVYCDRPSDDVADDLKKKMGVNEDSLMVISVPQSYSGLAPKAVKQWLQSIRKKAASTSDIPVRLIEE